MFLKIVAGSEQLFRFIVNGAIKTESVSETKLSEDRLFFEYFVDKLKWTWDTAVPFVGNERNGRFDAFKGLIAELDHVVLLLGRSSVEEDCDLLFNKFAEIINF